MDNGVIITYGSLLLTVVVSWFGLGQGLKFRPWYFLFLISLLAAYTYNFIHAYALLYTAVFGFACYRYQQTKNSWLAIPIIALAAPLFFHLGILGFNNYRFLDHVKITADAVPYSLYFNFDKTLICVFLLGFSSFRFEKEEAVMLSKQVPRYFLILALVMLGSSFLLGYVFFEPKLPASTLVWMPVNLFFVCTSEELLFRGIIQKELEKNLNVKYGSAVALTASAVLFGLGHYAGGFNYVLLATICGLFYGHIYHKTKKIRSSILLHFLLNLAHFLLFTYPALQK